MARMATAHGILVCVTGRNGRSPGTSQEEHHTKHTAPRFPYVMPPTSGHVNSLVWNVSILPSSLPHPTMPPPPSQRPFLPTLPNTELF